MNMKGFFVGAFVMSLVIVAIGLNRSIPFYCWISFTGIGSIIAFIRK